MARDAVKNSWNLYQITAGVHIFSKNQPPHPTKKIPNTRRVMWFQFHTEDVQKRRRTKFSPHGDLAPGIVHPLLHDVTSQKTIICTRVCIVPYLQHFALYKVDFFTETCSWKSTCVLPLDDGVVTCRELTVNPHKYLAVTDRVYRISDCVSESGKYCITVFNPTDCSLKKK